MGNSLRCCLACVLPCGALDLIRIVRLDGEIEEYGRPVSAREVLDANPNHVISTPSSHGAVARRIMIVSPESELKRGSIYFLIPASAAPPEKKRRSAPKSGSGTSTAAASAGAPGQGARAKEDGRGHRRRKGVAGWRPRLESIHED